MGKLYDKQELSKVLGFNVNKINNMVKKEQILKPKQFFDPSWGRYRHFWSQSDVNGMLKDKVRAREMLTADGVSKEVGASMSVVHAWISKGFMKGEVIFGRKMFDRNLAIECFNTWQSGGFKKTKKDKTKEKPKKINKEKMMDVTGDSPKRVISVAEMANLTSKGRTTIYRWVDKGILPKPLKKPDGFILGWTVEQYQDFLKSCGGE